MSVTVGLRGVLRAGARPSAAEPAYFTGSRVVWEADVVDRTTGAATDVTGLEFVWVSPIGAEIRDDATRVTTGRYRSALAIDTVGDWVVRIEAPSAIEADEKPFRVDAGALDPDAEDAVVVVTDDGEIILLDDGSGAEA